MERERERERQARTECCQIKNPFLFNIFPILSFSSGIRCLKPGRCKNVEVGAVKIWRSSGMGKPKTPKLLRFRTY